MSRRHRNTKSSKKLSDVQWRLMMAGLSAALMLLLAVFWPLGDTQRMTDVLKAKLDAVAQLHSIARQSDGEEFDYFKHNLLQPFLITRVSDTEGSRQVQQHIKTQMSQLGWHLQDDTFVDDTPYGQKTFTNIVAVQNPSAPHRLTLACHYDSKYFEDFEFIGATDSAVSCALMIDIARHLNDAFPSSKLKDTSLQLIFFDGEEAFIEWSDTDSLYGARHLSEQMDKTLVKHADGTKSLLQMVDLFILLDLIGTESTQFRNWFSQTKKFYTQLQQIEMQLAKEGLLEPREAFHKKRSNMYFTGARAVGGVADDHLPFLHKNVPIIHMISLPFPSEWHTAADNEAALHYPTINNIGKILRVFVAYYLQLNV